MSNNELSYAEFSRCLGVSRAIVTVNIQRGKIKANEKKKTINYQDPQNKQWIDDQVGKGKSWDLNRKNDLEAPVQKSGRKPAARKNGKRNGSQRNTPVLDEYQKQLRDIEYKKKLIELDKIKNEEHLKRLEIMKKQGDLVPVDAVKSVFLFSIETMRTLFAQELNSFASIYTEILEADEKTGKKLQRALMEKTNDVMNSLKESLKSGLTGVIKEYSETRNRGEKK